MAVLDLAISERYLLHSSKSRDNCFTGVQAADEGAGMMLNFSCR